jgi:hypothetical protein
VSEDGISWTAVELGIGDVSVASMAAGDGGLVLVAGAVDGTAQVWSSVDGMTWELTHATTAAEGVQLEEVAAGPEGFVIVGAIRTDADRPYVLASSDGRSWFTAADQPAFAGSSFPFDVAPLGPGWVATGFGATEDQQRSVIWRSADGLASTRDLGPVDPTQGNTYYATASLATAATWSSRRRSSASAVPSRIRPSPGTRSTA